MSGNIQPGIQIHPDADQLSVFVEGAATGREQEKMLAHLAECVECRKVVFLMQPREELQEATAAPEKGWRWRWLIPVGLPAAVLACGLIVVLLNIRPHRQSEPRQQVASVRLPESDRSGTAATPDVHSEQMHRSRGPKNGFVAKTPNKVSRKEHRVASDLRLSTSKSVELTVNGAAPSLTVDLVADTATISFLPFSMLPSNGGGLMTLQILQPADTKGSTLQGTFAKKNEPPAFQIEGISGQDEALAGLSGRITDRSGAVIVGATVTLHSASGKTSQTTTGADGGFHLTQLPAGQYELTAAAAGFKASKQSIELKPSELAMLQPVLDIGAAAETIEVQASGAAVSVVTEPAKVGGRAVAEENEVGGITAVPSGLPVAETVSRGKRFLSRDNDGNLFLSRNAGKKWKKIKPQWAGKAIRIELTTGAVREAAQTRQDEISREAGEGAVFLLTTDGGTVWSSKDGAHWHRQ